MLKYHIQTINLSSTQSSVSINNLPQGYSDLYILASFRLDTGTTGTYISFNGSTSNFSGRYLYADGSTPSTASLARYVGSASGNYTANTFNNTSIYIYGYSSSFAKTFSVDNITENNATRADQNIIAGLWENSAPIRSISIAPDVGSFVAGSTISIYGIKHGNDGVTLPAATGGIVTTSGGYTIHTFNSSGTFTANRNLTVEYLVVAGGGSGGGSYSGGGAGGYRSSVVGENSGGGAAAEPRMPVYSGTSHPVVVGAGGPQAGNFGGAGVTGSNSSFADIVSFGGGAGDGTNVSTNRSSNGGSGGGARPTAGAGTTGQGFAGGNSVNSFPYAAGGGGGAGAVGTIGSGTTGGNGGIGVQSSINGTPTYRAGGGGGTVELNGTSGSGGLGGGGAAGATGGNNPGQPGTANTGGGGGGGHYQTAYTSGGAGGSGVVIIRYLTP